MKKGSKRPRTTGRLSMLDVFLAGEGKREALEAAPI